MIFATPQPAGGSADAPSQLLQPLGATGSLVTVKRLIWLYFWLLILEGTLRKWFLPGWSNPLLLIRDPVVILIYIFATIAGVFPRNGFIPWIAGLAVTSVLFSELAGRGNLLVTLYGFRTSFLHLPLIFLIPNVFDKRDMERMGRWFLITSIPMCLIVLAQFRASPTDWINNGAGGSEGGQLVVGFGKIRPPGTFSFTSALAYYLSIVAAFVMYAQMLPKGSANSKLSLAAMPALAIMVAISGSRGALGSVFIVLLAVAVICIRKPVFFGRWMKSIAVVGAAYFVLASWSEFQQGMVIHQSRFEEGGGFKAGIFLRFLGELLEPFRAAFDAPFFGIGLGMGTNGASGFLYGRVVFNLGEGDWGRIVRESGAILGFAYIGLRVAILAYMTRRAFASLERNNPLPMLLLSAAFLLILNGQFGVPSILGFAVFTAGLCLAANNAADDPAPLAAPAPEQQLAPFVASSSYRGRSNYANELHGEEEDPTIARYGP